MHSIRCAMIVGMAWAGAAFAAPPVTEGLVAHFGADSVIGVGAQGTVVSWSDAAPANGTNTATATEGVGPTRVTGALPDPAFPVLRFDGSGDHLVLAGSPLTSQQFTIFAVARDTGSGSFREILSNWAFTNTVESVFLGTTGTDPVRLRFTDAIGGADQGQTGVGAIQSPGSFTILTAVSGATNAFLMTALEVQYSLGSPLPTRNLGGTWTLGRQGEFAGEYWNGDLAAVLVYDRELSQEEIASTVDYLGRATGIIPEPATTALLVLGLGAMLGARRARRRGR